MPIEEPRHLSKRVPNTIQLSQKPCSREHELVQSTSVPSFTIYRQSQCTRTFRTLSRCAIKVFRSQDSLEDLDLEVVMNQVECLNSMMKMYSMEHNYIAPYIIFTA